ncbi:MAG: ATP-binding protein, partial [Niabella sp.]
MKQFVTIFITFFLTVFLYAQQYEKINCQPLTNEQGLSQSSVLTIHQDVYGFIWLGTRDGLNLYDGSKIQIFKNIPGDTCSLSGNLINDVTNAADGNLWIAHNNGVSFFNRQTGKFKNYAIAATNSEIRSLLIIDKTILACGWSGLFVLDPQKDLFIPFKLSAPEMRMSFSISKIVASPKGNYWIASTNNGLFHFDIKTKKISKVFAERHTEYADVRIEDILFHPNGKAYIATYGKGLLECDPEGNILRTWVSGNTAGFKINNIRTLALSKNGEIWIGGFQGLAKIDPRNEAITHLTPVHITTEVKDISIRSLLVDKNGSVWMGSYHNGALLYDDYFSRFKTIPLKLNDSATAKGMVSAFAIAASGKTFVATENGYLLEYQNYTGASKAIHLSGSYKNQNPVIKSLYYDEASDHLWLGTLRNGLLLKQHNTFKEVPLKPLHVTAQNQYPEVGVINAIIPENEHLLWLLTDRAGGLHLFDKPGQQLIGYPALKQLIQFVGKGSVKYLLKIKNRSYLIATKSAGLIYFDNFNGGTIRKILPHIHDVNHVAAAESKIYVSTNGNGLYILDPSFKISDHITTNDHLKNDIVLSTLPDPSGGLWIYTFNGLSYLTANRKLFNYDTKNGFPLAEVNAWQFVNTGKSNPVFIAGGKDAWTLFNSAELFNNSYKPTVYITDIIVDNRSLPQLTGLFKNNQKRKLEINNNETMLTIEFAGSNYIMPQNNRFRYMLEGFDEDWIYTDYRGIARYTKIPAGTYTFKVQASNNDGIWSTHTATLTIKKHPPFWLSWKAFLLYLVIAGISIHFLRRNEINKIKLKQEILFKEAEQKRIDEAHALKLKHFNDISHEIRTPLTLILSPIEELIENTALSPKDKRKVLSMQYHGKNLLLLVNQLLEINRLELKKEKLNLSTVYIKELITVIHNSFQSIAQSSAIQWTVSTEKATEKPLLLDKAQMDKILLNLLSNAFKYTPVNGSVRLNVITIPASNNTVTIILEVTDSGIGIAPQDLPYVFDRFYKGEHQNNIVGSGIGLALVKAIVQDLMNGEIYVESEMGKGSVFKVTLPNISISDQLIADAENELSVPAGLFTSALSEDPYRAEDETKAENKESILIIEDNASVLQMLTEKLRDHFNVFGRESAEEGIEFLKDNDIDLVISDVMLPGINGKDFCAEVKSNILTSHIPVLLLTAIHEEESKIEGLELGADDYLTKPFVFKELFLRIHNLLKQRERWRNYFKSNDIQTKKPEARLNKYDEDLLNNINQQLETKLEDATYSVEDLGKAVGLSRVHLFRKLKALTGSSPSQYIRNFKLNKALQIIEQEDLRISELAYRVGFQDPNYFLKCFKEKFGQTPS